MEETNIEKLEFLLKVKREIEEIFDENCSSIYWEEGSTIMKNLLAVRDKIVCEILKL